MYCKNCGNQLNENAVICVKCGCATDNMDTYNLKKVYTKNNDNLIATQSSPAYCRTCGNKLKENEIVCTGCGCFTDNILATKNQKENTQRAKSEATRTKQIISVIFLALSILNGITLSTIGIVFVTSTLVNYIPLYVSIIYIVYGALMVLFGIIAIISLYTVTTKRKLIAISVLTLIFCNLVAGILMLLMTDDELSLNESKHFDVEQPRTNYEPTKLKEKTSTSSPKITAIKTLLVLNIVLSVVSMFFNIFLFSTYTTSAVFIFVLVYGLISIAISLFCYFRLDEISGRKDVYVIATLSLFFCGLITGILMFTLTDEELNENYIKKQD